MSAPRIRREKEIELAKLGKEDQEYVASKGLDNPFQEVTPAATVPATKPTTPGASTPAAGAPTSAGDLETLEIDWLNVPVLNAADAQSWNLEIKPLELPSTNSKPKAINLHSKNDSVHARFEGIVSQNTSSKAIVAIQDPFLKTKSLLLLDLTVGKVLGTAAVAEAGEIKALNRESSAMASLAASTNSTEIVTWKLSTAGAQPVARFCPFNDTKWVRDIEATYTNADELFFTESWGKGTLWKTNPVEPLCSIDKCKFRPVMNATGTQITLVQNNRLAIIDVTKRAVVAAQELKEELTGLAFSPDGMKLAGTTNVYGADEQGRKGTVVLLFNLATGAIEHAPFC